MTAVPGNKDVPEPQKPGRPKKNVAERYKNMPTIGKFGLILGFSVGTYKAIVHSPGTLRGKVSMFVPLGIWAKYTVFGGVTGFVYNSGLYVTRQVRQKQDYGNHFLMGGVVSIPFSVLRNMNPANWVGKFIMYGIVAATADYCMNNAKKAPGLFIENKSLFRLSETGGRYPMMYVNQEVLHRQLERMAMQVYQFLDYDIIDEDDDDEVDE